MLTCERNVIAECLYSVVLLATTVSFLVSAVTLVSTVDICGTHRPREQGQRSNRRRAILTVAMLARLGFLGSENDCCRESMQPANGAS